MSEQPVTAMPAKTAPAKPSDPPRRSIQLPTGPAAFIDEGPDDPGQDLPVIVAIHGLPGSARDFRWLAPQLSHAVRVVRLDLPGFGETPVATEPDRSPEGRARFALEVIRALDLKRPVLVGHSMGGVVATAAVDLAPDEIGGLALLSSPGPTAHKMLRHTPFRLASWWLSLPLVKTAMRPLVRSSFGAIGFKRYPDRELYGTVHCVARTSTARHAERIARLRLPTMVAYCQDDPLIETPVLDELAAACPDGPRLVFEKGGHNPQKTHAAAIARELLAWPS